MSFGQTANKYLETGMAKKNNNDYSEAIANFKKAMEINPNLKNLKGYLFEVYFNRAMQKQKKRDYTGAILDLNDALALDIDLINPAEIYLARGDVKNDSEDYNGALADYDKVIELPSPPVALFYLKRARVKAYLVDYIGSINDCNKALELEPNKPEALKYRAVTNYIFFNKIKACKDIRKAIELGLNGSNNQQLIKLFCSSNRTISEEDKLKNEAQKYHTIALKKIEEKDYIEAINNWTKAINIISSVKFGMISYYYNNRGWSRREIGDHTKAIMDYNKSIELNPDYASAYVNRAMSKKALNDNLGACADAQKAKELGLLDATQLIEKFCN